MSYKPNLRQPYPNELYHHGIKGQKWGVRRFQNSDGSYTEAGKKRYNSGGFRKLDEDLTKAQVKRYAALHANSLVRAMRKELAGEGDSGLSDAAIDKLIGLKEGWLSKNPVKRQAMSIYWKRAIDRGVVEPRDPNYDWTLNAY